MKEVRIEIENTDLRELGVDQPEQYAPFRFKESHFNGYWITKNDETQIEKIIFYVGGITFMCKYCKKNIDIFESILNDSSDNNNIQ